MKEYSKQKEFQKELLYAEDDIKIGFFSVSFENEEIEEKYQNFVKGNNFNYSIFFFIILGVYYTLFIYNGVKSYKHISSYTFASGSVLITTIIHICFYYYCERINYKNFNLFIIHILFQFYHINHLFKAYFYKETDKYEEIVRLFYAYVIINISFYLLVIPLSRIHYYITQVIVLLIPIIYFNIKSKLGTKFVTEYCIITFSLIIHELKKKNEISIRLSFLELCNRNRIFQYYEEFKNFIDNKNFTLNNEKLAIYMNDPLNILMNELNEENKEMIIVQNDDNNKNKDPPNNILNEDNWNLDLNNLMNNLKAEYLIETLKINENSTLTNVIDYVISTNEETFSNKNFEKIGIFSLSLKSLIRYYEVSYKFFQIDNKKYLIDILMNDITNLKNSERNMAEEKIKHKILSKIAHEFKTPLIMIINQLNELNDLPSMKNNLEVKDICNQNIKLSEYMTFLINDIIYYVSDMKCSVKIKEIDIFEVLNFSYEILKTFIKTQKKNIVPYMEIDESLNNFIIDSDDMRLKQILLNFISNAVKFTRDGNIKISCYIRKEENKYNLVIEVEDSGLGIKQEDLEIIKSNCDKNINLSLDKNYNRMGTGIGLNISKSVISSLENHAFNIESKTGIGTQISVIINDVKKKIYISNEKRKNSSIKSMLKSKSNPKIKKESIEFKNFDDELNLSKTKCLKKSSFFLYNKFQKDDNSSLNNNDSIIGSQESGIIDTEYIVENFNFEYNFNSNLDEIKNFIIVCDDNCIIRKSMSKLITATLPNSKIIECFDGIDTLRKIIEYKKIDLIFIDENMQFMQGSTCIKIISELIDDNKINPIKLISCTAFEDEDTKLRIKDSGAHAILSKPINKNDLLKCLNEVSFIYN